MIVWKGYPGRAENAWYKYNMILISLLKITFTKLFPDTLQLATGSSIWRTFAFTEKGIKAFIMVNSFIFDKKLNKNFENDQFLRLSDYSFK